MRLFFFDKMLAQFPNYCASVEGYNPYDYTFNAHIIPQQEYKILYVLSKADLKKGLIPIPQDQVYPTVGSACCMSNVNPEPKSRTVCMLFQTQNCHEGYKCHQIHVFHELWRAICDADFFSPLQHLPSEGEIYVMYREKGKTTARSVSVPAQHAYITKGSEAYFNERGQTGASIYKEVCTYFQKNACNYRYNCNQVHIDSAVWKRLVEMQRAISPVVTIPERRPLQPKDMNAMASSASPEKFQSYPVNAVPGMAGSPNETLPELSLCEAEVPPSPGPLLPFPPLPTQLPEGRSEARRATVAGPPYEIIPSNNTFRRHTFGAALLLSPERAVAPQEGVVALVPTSDKKPPSRRVIRSLNTLSDWIQCGPLGPAALQDQEEGWKTASPAANNEYSFVSEAHSLFSERKSSTGTDGGDSPGPSPLADGREHVWVTFNSRDAKVRRTKEMEDVSDLRDAIFGAFAFPKNVVPSDLKLWLNDKELDIRQPISTVDTTNTVKITIASE
jgi:hypothetical protein